MQFRSRCMLASALMLAASASAWAIPSDECVLFERRARIAGFKSQAEERLAILEEASKKCGGQVSLLFRLKREYRQLGGHQAQQDQIHQQLVALVSGEDVSAHLGLLDRILDDPLTTEEDLELLEIANRKMVTLEPGSIRWLETLARIRALRGDLKESREIVDRLIALDDRPIYHTNAYQLDVALSRWEPALAYLRSRPAQEQNEWTTQSSMVFLLAKLGHTAELLERSELILEKGRSIEWLLIDVLIPAAWTLYDAGELEQAERYFRMLEANYPEKEELHKTVLHLFATEQERAERAAASEKSWASEEDPVALLREGSARLAAGDAVAAYPLIERATKAGPDWPVGWFNLGLAAIQLERWDAAEDALTRALLLNADLMDANYNRGIVRIQLERYGDALADLMLYAGKYPEKKDVWYYIFSCHKAMGDEKAAAEAIKRYQ